MLIELSMSREIQEGVYKIVRLGSLLNVIVRQHLPVDRSLRTFLANVG